MLSQEEASIEYLKSGISINTKLGCLMGCKYCIVSEFQNSIQKTYNPKELVDKLLQSRFYDNNIPLIINNRSEPLTQDLRDETLEILHLLKEKEIKNKKIIISKLPFGEIDYSALNQNNVYIFRTISGMPRSVESFSTETNLKTILAENFQLKRKTDVKIIHHWRPLVRGLNTDPDQIFKLLTAIIPYFDASVVSGIRVTKRLKNILEKLGADLSDWNNDINHKFLPVDIRQLIIDTRDKINKSYPLYTHTSCAISSLEHKPDYNMHYTKLKNEAICKKCHNYPICINSSCEIQIPALEKCFKKLRKKFNYEIVDNKVHITSPIYQDEVAFIKQTTHYVLITDNVLKSGSEGIINTHEISLV